MFQSKYLCNQYSHHIDPRRCLHKYPCNSLCNYNFHIHYYKNHSNCFHTLMIQMLLIKQGCSPIQRLLPKADSSLRHF